MCNPKLKFENNKLILRIGYYSTVSTDDGVLVIGGDQGSLTWTSVVAEYKDESWTNIGNLARPTAQHKAMRSGSNILILGGMWPRVNGEFGE